MTEKFYPVVLGLLLAVLVILGSRVEVKTDTADLEKSVLPPGGVILPITWGDLGIKMVERGVLDPEKLQAVYGPSGDLSGENNRLLTEKVDGNIKITAANANFLLTLLWGFGLSNKNEILERGPMTDPQYGGAQVFASTGGWTLSKGNAMEHYAKYQFVPLNAQEQALVERVSKNIYRPCCDNPTYFPDCNHGMAMLGLLELMAAQGVSETEMYQVALQVNSFWFPGTYLTIAKYLATKGLEWIDVDPKVVLGVPYSSASGYQEVLKQLLPVERDKSSSCSL